MTDLLTGLGSRKSTTVQVLYEGAGPSEDCCYAVLGVFAERHSSDVIESLGCLAETLTTTIIQGRDCSGHYCPMPDSNVYGLSSSCCSAYQAGSRMPSSQCALSPKCLQRITRRSNSNLLALPAQAVAWETAERKVAAGAGSGATADARSGSPDGTVMV